MIHNPNIKKLVLLTLLSKIGLTLFSKMNELILVEKGIGKEIISLISLINKPVQIIILIMLRNENKNIMKNVVSSFYYLIIASIANLIILLMYSQLIYYNFKLLTIVLGICITVIFSSCYKIYFASSQSFIARRKYNSNTNP